MDALLALDTPLARSWRSEPATSLSVERVETLRLYHFHPGSAALVAGGRAAPEAVARAATQAGCRSVALRGDPAGFTGHAAAVAQAARAAGLCTVAVSAAHVDGARRRELFDALDAVSVTVDSLATGALEAIEQAVGEARCWVELVTTLVPTWNDGEGELEQLCAWVRERLGPTVPLHFSTRGQAPQERISARRAQRIALQAGIEFAYADAMGCDLGASTFCPNCEASLLERRGGALVSSGLERRACTRCGFELPGRF